MNCPFSHSQNATNDLIKVLSRLSHNISRRSANHGKATAIELQTVIESTNASAKADRAGLAISRQPVSSAPVKAPHHDRIVAKDRDNNIDRERYHHFNG
jgi:hypothetical protein